MKSERECRKCGDIIPWKIKIDGSQRSLKSRKFCLTCSPYKRHNTSPYDPFERKKKGNYDEWSKKNKENVTLSLYKRALERKFNLIKIKGGACKICGYNKYYGSLTFHHIKPEEKKFGLSLNNLWSKTWEEIEGEATKCDLLCANCHGEIESQKSNIAGRVNEKYGTNF